jgi:hypothetical protein
MKWLYEISKTVFDTCAVLLLLGLSMAPCCDIAALEASKRERATEMDIPAIKKAVETYRRVAGHPPASLKQLVETGLIDKLPTDPWDEPYIYSVTCGAPTVGSYGKDKAPGGTDNDADIGFEVEPVASCP